MWPIEARCAAIANNYFTVAINRIGTVSIVWPHVFLNTLYSFFFFILNDMSHRWYAVNVWRHFARYLLNGSFLKAENVS